MKNFIDLMDEALDNVSVTENGMEGYKTTKHPILDMYFKVSSYRNLTDTEIVKDFKEVLKSDDSKLILKFLFMIRDVREGLGERRLFRVCLNELVKQHHRLNISILEIIKLIPEYGRWDDLFLFMGTVYESEVVAFIKKTLESDAKKMAQNEPITLLAKWMPSENASSKDTKDLARNLMKGLNMSNRTYRKTLSKLRSYMKVVEVSTSANRWDEIDYNAVPSKANIKYKDAFIRHDEERRRQYLAKLAVGDTSVKINSVVNYPHEIVSMYNSCDSWCSRLGAYDEAIEQLWKNLKDMEGMTNTIVCRDGSGSMTCRIQNNGKTTALDVATALTVYCAERLKDEFKNKFITFSSKPEIVDLSSKYSLHSKLKHLEKFDDCSNTNLEAVFDLILDTAVENRMSQEDIPAQLLIVSDMEFDSATTSYNRTGNVIKAASQRFANAGYKLPKLVFWNVCSRTNTIPCKENENGVLLVSGFSVNALKMVMSGETDPYKALLQELERYADIPEWI